MRGGLGGGLAPFPGAALILTWDSLQTDLTPTWIFDYDDVAVADVVTLQRASDSGFTTSVTSYTDTIDSISPITTLDFATGDWAEQTWYVRAKQSRDGYADSDWSNTEQILLSSDVTAPVLSSPTDTNSGANGYSGSVSTDEGNGTLYWVVSTASNAPSATQIIAGQMHTGAAAAASGSQAVSGTGEQVISGSGLSEGTTYYIHYAQRDAANNNSNVSSGNGLATTDVTAPTLSSPVDASSGNTTGSGSVSTNEGNGTLYWVVSTSATPPSAAQVKAGNDHTGSAAVDSGNQAVSGTGVQNVSGGFTGLSAATTYYAHYMHEDAGTNQSSVSSADGFTTDAGGAFDVSFLSTQFSTTDTATWTFSGISLGDADPGRTICVAVYTRKNDPTTTISSVTIGGVSATLISGTADTLANGGSNNIMAMYEADVPTGTTGDLVITCAAATLRMACAVYRVVSGTSSSGGIAKNASVQTLNTGSSLVIPTDGVGICYAFNAAASDFSPWTNLTTEDFEAIYETTRCASGGRRTTAGSTQVTATAGTVGEMMLCWAAYGP